MTDLVSEWEAAYRARLGYNYRPNHSERRRLVESSTRYELPVLRYLMREYLRNAAMPLISEFLRFVDEQRELPDPLWAAAQLSSDRRVHILLEELELLRGAWQTSSVIQGRIEEIEEQLRYILGVGSGSPTRA